MQQTTNYNLNKFDSTDELESATRVGLNENADTIDTALKGIQDDIDGLDASDVSYDNTVSGLTATDVQAALDEELDKINILSNSVSDLVDYSTTETVVGTWVDGKPLYRKVIQATLTAARNEINHSISDLKSVTKAEGFIMYNAETYHIPSWEDSLKNAQILNITQTKLVVTIGTSWSALYNNRPCTVILEYTKTTD